MEISRCSINKVCYYLFDCPVLKKTWAITGPWARGWGPQPERVHLYPDGAILKDSA